LACTMRAPSCALSSESPSGLRSSLTCPASSSPSFRCEKPSFPRHLILSPDICQDRLGTNTGKTQNGGRFLAVRTPRLVHRCVLSGPSEADRVAAGAGCQSWRFARRVRQPNQSFSIRTCLWLRMMRRNRQVEKWEEWACDLHYQEATHGWRPQWTDTCFPSFCIIIIMMLRCVGWCRWGVRACIMAAGGARSLGRYGSITTAAAASACRGTDWDSRASSALPLALAGWCLRESFGGSRWTTLPGQAVLSCAAQTQSPVVALFRSENALIVIQTGSSQHWETD
jgi:hypothetical protein